MIVSKSLVQIIKQAGKISGKLTALLFSLHKSFEILLTCTEVSPSEGRSIEDRSKSIYSEPLKKILLILDDLANKVGPIQKASADFQSNLQFVEQRIKGPTFPQCKTEADNYQLFQKVLAGIKYFFNSIKSI